MQYLTLLLLFGVMYAVLILPQQRRVRRHEELVAALEVGDEVLTSSGIYGRIVGLEEDGSMRLEVAEGVVVAMTRAAVAEVAVDEVAVDEVAGDAGEDPEDADGDGGPA